MVEQRRDHRFPVGPDRKVDGVLRLTGTVDAERRHTTAEKFVLDAEHLLFRRIQAGDDQDERWSCHLSRTAEVAGNGVALEGNLEAFRRRIEAGQRSPVDGDSPVPQ